MTKPGFLGLIILLAATLALMPISQAQACSCADQTESQLFGRADTVFTGMVTGRTDPNAGASVQSSMDPITWKFRADSVARGSVSNPVQILSARSEASCGTTFAVGRRYLVYARQVSSHLETGLCAGNREAGQLSFTPVAATGTTDPGSGGIPSPAVLAIVGSVVVVGGTMAMLRLRQGRMTED